MINVTSMEAQDRLLQLLDAAQQEPILISESGRAAAFIISPQDMEELWAARRQRETVAAEFERWSTEAAGRTTPAAAALTDEDVTRLVHESR